MDDWSKGFFESLESLVDIVDDVVGEVVEIIEDVAEEWQNTIGLEIEKCLEDIFEPIIEIYFEYDEIDLSTHESDIGFPYSGVPTAERHPACIGCHHYHGQVYGGNVLVCGMHPYGWDGENCPDWEAHPSTSIHEDFNPF